MFVTAALENKLYESAGKLMATSLIHGGPLPAFLHIDLYHAIADSFVLAKPTVEDVKQIDNDLYIQLLQASENKLACIRFFQITGTTCCQRKYLPNMPFICVWQTGKPTGHWGSYLFRLAFTCAPGTGI